MIFGIIRLKIHRRQIMINLAISKKCLKCKKFSPGKRDENEKLSVCPSVNCFLDEDMPLMWDSEIPEGCPYILEQTLTEEIAFDIHDELNEE
jgi:hypothetical protein